MVMTHYESVKRKRHLVVWIVTVATCAAVVLTDLLVQPLHVRVLGLAASSGLAGAKYVTATAMCVTTFRWFRVAKPTQPITVQELRRAAGRHRVH